MFKLQLFAILAFLTHVCLGQVESYQRWLMIIKPRANAGGEFNGQLNQEQIDKARDAFMNTWPKTIRDITNGKVVIEPHVEVSNIPVTQVSKESLGMVYPEAMKEDVAKWVDPAKYDGVMVYNAYQAGSYWGTTSAAGVGWVSMPWYGDLSYGGWAMAGWTHEMLHTLGWYFDDARLGPIAPRCAQINTGRDGTHCGEAMGYTQDQFGLKNWLAYYRDLLNGNVKNHHGQRVGLGSKAWKFGSRVEHARGVKPGSTIPQIKSLPAWTPPESLVDIYGGGNSTQPDIPFCHNPQGKTFHA